MTSVELKAVLKEIEEFIKEMQKWEKDLLSCSHGSIRNSITPFMEYTEKYFDSERLISFLHDTQEDIKEKLIITNERIARNEQDTQALEEDCNVYQALYNVIISNPKAKEVDIRFQMHKAIPDWESHLQKSTKQLLDRMAYSRPLIDELAQNVREIVTSLYPAKIFNASGGVIPQLRANRKKLCEERDEFSEASKQIDVQLDELNNMRSRLIISGVIL